jgi:hypothetical protein
MASTRDSPFGAIAHTTNRRTSMFKPTLILMTTAAVLFGASSLAGGAETSRVRQPAVSVIAILGRPVEVPAGQFRKAYAFCPKGYYVTGGGAYYGAIVEVASSPTPNLRGWFVDGTNNDPLKRTFSHRADAVCVKGSPVVTVAAAASSGPLRQAEQDSALTNRAP